MVPSYCVNVKWILSLTNSCNSNFRCWLVQNSLVNFLAILLNPLFDLRLLFIFRELMKILKSPSYPFSFGKLFNFNLILNLIVITEQAKQNLKKGNFSFNETCKLPSFSHVGFSSPHPFHLPQTALIGLIEVTSSTNIISDNRRRL